MAKVKKVEKEEEVKVPYLLVNYLVEKVNLLKVPTYGDIQKFKELQSILDEINQELQSKIKELFVKYKITEVKEGDEHYDDINKDYQNLIKSNSSFVISKLQIFNNEDFKRVYNGSDMNLNDALTLEYWLVKQPD